MALRGSLRALARAALQVAKMYPDAMFYIVKHPAAKYYSLCDPEEFNKLTDPDQPQNVEPVFCGTKGELLSLIQCDIEQLDLFLPTEEMKDLEKQAHDGTNSLIPQQYDV